MEAFADALTVGRRRAPGSRLFLVALFGLAGVTGLGSFLAWQAARDAADERAAQLAEDAATALEARVRAAASGLAGADVLLDGGALSIDRFFTFAEGLRRTGDVRGAVLIDAVTAAERADFEAVLGREIYAVGEGGERPAPRVPHHYVVIAAVPAEIGDAVLGFDYGTDPVRGPALEAAAATGEPAISGVVSLRSNDQPGFLIARPLGQGAGEPPGFLAVSVALDSLTSSAVAPLGPRDRYELLDGDARLAGADLDDVPGAVSAPVEVLGASWDLAVAPGRGADLTLARFLLLAGAGGVVVFLTLLVLTRSHQRRLAAANAQLAAAEGRARAVQELAGNLARSLSGDEVATVLLRRLPGLLGASAAALSTIDEAGSLVLAGAHGHPDDEVEALALLDPPTESLVAAVVAELEPRWLSSPLAWRGDQATATMAGAAGWALALVPLVADQVRGVLAVSYPAVHTFADDERDLIATIAAMAARALARARRYDAEHAAALAFQRSALPDALPEVPGLLIAARYRPASRRAAVGGDWYDVLVLGDEAGSVACIVGDVVGHGMPAAAAMGRLRTACQAVAPLVPDAGALVRSVSEQASTIRDALCTTMVCATIEVATGSLLWSRAGHPPPLLIDAEGATAFLDDPSLPPLGVGTDVEDVTHRAALRPGHTLVLYSDGVVERRNERLDDSLRRLAVAAAALVDLEPEEFCDALLEAMVPAAAQADDVVLLVVRIAPPAVGEP